VRMPPGHRPTARGQLPGKRTRPDGSVEVPVSDLVADGLLDPVTAGGSLPELVTRTRTERDLIESRQLMALERAKVEARDTLL
jgi:hypothetical protein